MEEEKEIRLLASQLNAMISAAEIATDDGKEICGFLIDNGYFLSMVQVRNKEKLIGKSAFYVSEVRRLVKAVKVLGCEIVGTFHSHPMSGANLSKGDIDSSEDDDLVLIISTPKKEEKLWYINKNKGSREIKFELLP